MTQPNQVHIDLADYPLLGYFGHFPKIVQENQRITKLRVKGVFKTSPPECVPPVCQLLHYQLLKVFEDKDQHSIGAPIGHIAASPRRKDATVNMHINYSAQVYIYVYGESYSKQLALNG